jgi:hypothetical protein
MIKRWEELESWMSGRELLSPTFTSVEYADATGLSRKDASRNIQAYLWAQRRPDVQTAYIIKRVPGTRTSAAIWKIGTTARDQRMLGDGFANDARNRFKTAVTADLRAMAVINPRTERRARLIIDGVMDGAMVVLESALKGITDED